MPKYTPIAVAGAIAAAVVMTAATSTDANANTPGCRHRVNPYVACTDRLRARMPVRQVLRGHRAWIEVPSTVFHRRAGLGFRRR
jgi:hypothetical protein